MSIPDNLLMHEWYKHCKYYQILASARHRYIHSDECINYILLVSFKNTGRFAIHFQPLVVNVLIF